MIIQIGLKKMANLYFVAWQTTSAVNIASFVLPSYVQASLRQRAPFFPYRSKTSLFLLALEWLLATAFRRYRMHKDRLEIDYPLCLDPCAVWLSDTAISSTWEVIGDGWSNAAESAGEERLTLSYRAGYLSCSDWRNAGGEALSKKKASTAPNIPRNGNDNPRIGRAWRKTGYAPFPLDFFGETGECFFRRTSDRFEA